MHSLFPGLSLWPGPVFAVYLGLLEPEAMLIDMNAKSDQFSIQLSESYFYLGQWYLLQQRTDKARAMFEATIAKALTYSVEYTHAKAELKQL